MVSTIPRNVKKLGNLLQEEQEPFILDIYLLERSPSKKNMNSICRPGDNYGLKESSGGIKNKGRGISRFSNLLKAVCNKFVLIDFMKPRLKNSQRNDGQLCSSTSAISANRNKQEVVESDRFSCISSSSSTVSNSGSQSDTEESWKDTILSASDTLDDHNNSGEQEVDYGKRWSPVSVLEELSSQEESPLHKTQEDYITKQESHPSISSIFQNQELAKEYILSASLMELLAQSSITKQESHGRQEHINSIRILQETKQLLLDCVGEVLEAHRRSKWKQQLFIYKEFLGCEEIGKLICEKLIAWDEQRLDGTQLEFVFDSAVNWNDYETEKKESVFDIGDMIVEDITNEIVIDFISLDFYSNIYA